MGDVVFSVRFEDGGKKLVHKAVVGMEPEISDIYIYYLPGSGSRYISQSSYMVYEYGVQSVVYQYKFKE